MFYVRLGERQENTIPTTGRTPSKPLLNKIPKEDFTKHKPKLKKY
jgi:hypothetical protein